ncbi:transposase [bacterium]|nr:transposase [bacterium]
MKQRTELVQQMQTKLYQFLYRFEKNLSVPEWKWLRDMVLGIMKGKHIHLASIQRELGGKASPKKIQERLSYHLRKASFGHRVMESFTRWLKSRRARFDFVIVDGSDISKPHAQKMEQLGWVRDGSQSKRSEPLITRGYHWLNILGVSLGEVQPLGSAIYSTEHVSQYEKSENSKILLMLERIGFCLGVIVMDRGGDRRVLMNEFLRKGWHFIIRQQGDRMIQYLTHRLTIRDAARRIRFTHRVTLKNGEKREVGVVKIQWLLDDLKTASAYPLFLLAMRGDRGELSWYLASLPTTNHWQALHIIIEGYGHRWAIEEFHRQVKQDYSLEKIKVMNYHAIQNLATILLIVLTFVAKLHPRLIQALITVMNLLDTRKWNAMPDFLNYKIALGIKRLFQNTTQYHFTPTIDRSNNLCLKL